MIRLHVRGAPRIACILCLMALPSACPALEPGIVKIVGDSGQGSGVAIQRAYPAAGGEFHVILTANHVVAKGSSTIDGRPVIVLAREPETDLALVQVELPQRRDIYWYAPKWFNPVGRAKLFGFPGGKYEVQDCTVDETGALNCEVRGGGSGGPLFKDGYVIGILTRYHGVATSKQIYAFLGKHGYLSGMEPAEPK